MAKRDGIRKRGDVWEVRVSLGWDDRLKRYRRMSVTVRGTKADAERKRRELLRQLDEGTYVDPTKQTVSSYLKDWLRHCEQRRLAASTIEGYTGICDRYLIPVLGSVPLQKLTPAHIEALYSELLKAGSGASKRPLSARSVLHVHRVLHSALRRAVRLKLLIGNPCEAVEPPRPRRKEMHALDEQETSRMLALLDAGSDPLMSVAVLVALTTGMRRGEILGLRWSDVDLEAATATVSRSLQTTKITGLAFKEPKTSRSRRTVTLPARTVRTLRAHKKRQAAERLLAGPGYRDQGLVFAEPDGGPYDPAKLSDRFRRFRAANKFTVRFHDLRHTHATLLLKAGVPVKVVSDRLGHSTAMLTLDTYAHVLPGMDASAAEGFDRMLEEAERKAGS